MIQLYIYKYLFFFISFRFRLLQYTEQNSLRYTVGPWWLTILNNSSVYMSIPNPQPISPLPSPVAQSAFSKSVSLFLFFK